MSEKIYCGNAKIIETKFGGITKVSFHKDNINAMVKWMKENKSDWINIAIMEKQNPEQGKPTHYGVIDEWKPKETKLPPSDIKAEDVDDDLPF
jgi:hypothetical protein